MKIQCDVCSKKEASVYCTADEAALCDECDRSIHHANKLASKHERFSLLHPSSSNFPVCDICQEKRALIFCQQDRAILCRDCEIPLHTSNEHTKKHNRFLLTGIKLSSTTMISNSNKKDDDTIIITNNNINHNEAEDPVPNYKSTQKPTSNFPEKTTTVSNSAISFVTSNSNNINNNNNNNNKFCLTNNNNNNNQLMINNGGSTTSTSNISEYLIDMLPGWHFEDLIVDSASPASLAFSKGNQNFEVNEDVMSYFDDKELTSSSTHHQSENFWVPQATHLTTTTTNAGISNVFGQQNYSGIHQNYTSGLFYGTTKQQHQQQQETNNVNNTLKMKRKYMKDDDITVPQIYSSVGSNKRNRPFW